MAKFSNTDWRVSVHDKASRDLRVRGSTHAMHYVHDNDCVRTAFHFYSHEVVFSTDMRCSHTFSWILCDFFLVGYCSLQPPAK